MRWSFAVSILVLAGCAVGSTSGTNDFSVDGTAPAVDAGPDTSVHYDTPAGDDDDDTPTDGGTTIDSGKDSGKPTSACSFSGSLVTFDLASLSGVTTQAPATNTATGITATALKRTGVTATSVSGGFNSSAWPTGALDTSKYLSFTLTAPSGCAVTASSVSVILESSNTGPSSASLATSSDSYASKKSATTAGATSNVNVNVEVTAGDTLEVRIYGYSASAAGGTMRASNSIVVNGSIH